ncbi:MAG TPA: proline racemase family protein [Candidatus Dormibacteraeota bacterium]|nr:proline racemase family protein [Candidatus Dormibacteraeota bacterium]
MKPAARTLSVVDYHTEGEPMRIVVAGVARVPGATLMEQSDHLAAHGRELLGFTLYEPRGHSAMCGAILTEPVTAGADAGVLFIEPLGPVHMCGHGAIALGAMLVETGRVAAPEGRATVTLETPAGLVSCRVVTEPDRPTAVTIRNVPAFSAGLDLAVEVRGLGRVAFDLAYGGHFYALVEAAPLGLSLEPKDAPRLVEAGERIRLAIEATVPLVHPAMPAARGLLYIQFYEPARRPDAQLRNAVVVAPAGLDRSPCGTGTSARLANLHARGRLGVGEAFGHESIIGTLFTGRIAGLTQVAGTPAVVPEITGRAWMSGTATLSLDPSDPFPGGFLL